MSLNPLQQIELDEIEALDEETKEQFKINSIDQANWAFRKLSALAAKEKEVKVLAEIERERINQYEKNEMKSIENQRSFFESLLIAYAFEQRNIDPKFKAKTPYGSIGFRKQQPKWEYDEIALVQSLKNIGLNDLIRVKEEPDKTAIKKTLHVLDGQVIDPDTGALVEGVKVTPLDDKITISVEV